MIKKGEGEGVSQGTGIYLDGHDRKKKHAARADTAEYGESPYADGLGSSLKSSLALGFC